MSEGTCKVVNFQLSWQRNGQFYMMNCLSGSDLLCYNVLVAMFNCCVVGQQALSLIYQRIKECRIFAIRKRIGKRGREPVK